MNRLQLPERDPCVEVGLPHEPVTQLRHAHAGRLCHALASQLRHAHAGRLLHALAGQLRHAHEGESPGGSSLPPRPIVQQHQPVQLREYMNYEPIFLDARSSRRPDLLH